MTRADPHEGDEREYCQHLLFSVHWGEGLGVPLTNGAVLAAGLLEAAA